MSICVFVIENDTSAILTLLYPQPVELQIFTIYNLVL